MEYLQLPLEWFKSYLSERTQSVIINDNESEPSPLDDGVPQGSVFGPLGFTMYTAPLEDIIKSHLGVEYMVYADDTQLYMVINASDKDQRISQLENCISDVKQWMAANKLKLNDGKTEILHLTSKFANNVTSLDSLQIGSSLCRCGIQSTQLRCHYRQSHYSLRTSLKRFIRIVRVNKFRVLLKIHTYYF